MIYNNNSSRLRLQRPPDEADERAAERAWRETEEGEETPEERELRRVERQIDKLRDE